MLKRFEVKQTTTKKNKNNNKTLFLHTTSVIPFYSPVPLDGLWTFFISNSCNIFIIKHLHVNKSSKLIEKRRGLYCFMIVAP